MGNRGDCGDYLAKDVALVRLISQELWNDRALFYLQVLDACTMRRNTDKKTDLVPVRIRGMGRIRSDLNIWISDKVVQKSVKEKETGLTMIPCTTSQIPRT